MASFRYRALDPSGRTVSATMEADNERQVRSKLRDQRMKPLDVTPATQSRLTGGASPWRWLVGRRSLPVAQLSLLTRQLASLIQSGLPIDEALLISSQQARHQRVQNTLSQVRSRVMEGHTLAQAMAEHPAIFDRLYCAMIRAGEASGYLGQVMARLADYTDRSRHARQKMQMALMYPLVLLGVSILVVTLLMSLVVPRLIAMFASSGRELPALTKLMIQISDFLGSIWAWICLLLVVALISAFQAWLRADDHRLRWHRWLLKVPGVNELIRQIDSARFATTLAILLDSGVPLLESVRIAAEVMSNEAMRLKAEDVARSVQEGAGFSSSLRQSRVFPPLLVQMTANGEANGTLAGQLSYAAENQETELQLRIATLVALMEPLTIVIMGGLVTLIMLAVLLPIFNINTLI